MKEKKPNIILIVMDATRAQNMSCYGYERKTVPMLEKILPNCMLYENAISSSYWTLPSHASMFTGTYLSKHCLEVDGDTLNPKFITIAELLRAKGYITVGLCKNPYVSSFSGLDRGFKRFYDYQSIEPILYRLHDKLFKARLRGMKEMKKKSIAEKIKNLSFSRRLVWFLTGNLDKGAKVINNLVFKLVKKIEGKPFFIFIHYDETHTPYRSPKIFRERFLTVPMKAKKPWNVNQNPLRYYFGEAKMNEWDFSILRALYDGQINYLDKRIYELYTFLEKEELLDNTMMIITSDHGDNLGEHNILFHYWCLYDTLIKVPLIIKYPRELNISGEENRVVQNVDILPTIMGILRVRNKDLYNQIQGNSLVTSGIKYRRYSYGISELMKTFGPAMSPLRKKFKRYDRRLICIRTKDKKYIHSSNGKHEFYDLNKDPSECQNIINSGDPMILKLKEELKPWLKTFNYSYENNKERFDGVKRFKLDTDIKERLRKLGYL